MSSTSPSSSTTPSASTSASTLESTAEMRSSQSQPISLLFVCLGNICRSPMAEAVFRNLLSSHDSHSHPLARRFSTIDSAGTGAYHAGAEPDARTMEVLKRNGIEGYEHFARKVVEGDLVGPAAFDWIFAMDGENLEDLVQMRDAALRRRRKRKDKTAAIGDEEKMGNIVLFGDFGGKKGEEVGDPYYGGGIGFRIAFEQVNRFGKGFLKALEDGTVDEVKGA